MCSFFSELHSNYQTSNTYMNQVVINFDNYPDKLMEIGISSALVAKLFYVVLNLLLLVIINSLHL